MNSKAKGCLIGCAGLVIVGLVVVLLAGVFVARSITGHVTELDNEILAEEGSSLVDVTPDELGRSFAGELASTPLRITIDFEEGLYAVRAAAEGEEFSLGGYYDPSRHDAEFKTFGDRDRPEHVLVRVEPAPGNIAGDPEPIVLTLPRDRPLDLHFRMRKGEASVDLTGLAVMRLAIDVSMGNTIISTREPNAVAMTRLDVRGSMGNLELRGLALAGPREIDFAGSMGNFLFDLDGPLETDVVSRMSVRAGNVEIHLPERSTHSFARRSARFGNIFSERRATESAGDVELDTLPPHVELDLSAALGNIDIREGAPSRAPVRLEALDDDS